MEIKKQELLLCPICKCNNFHTLLKTKDFESDTGDYCIINCLNCNINFTNPQPLEEDIHLLYRDRNTADFPDTGSLVSKLRSIKIQRELKKLIVDLKISNFKALDFGCGDGFFCREIAKREDCQIAYATDFHEIAPEIIRDQEKIKYIPLDKFNQSVEKFNIIFCKHVVEHILDPVKFLSNLKRKLKKGGYLYLEVPDYNSVWRKIFSTYYAGLYVPRHLFHFNKKSISNILSDYRIKSIKQTHTPFIGLSLGYLTSLPVTNVNLNGLIFFPLQVIVDLLFNRSSVLTILAQNE